MKFLKRDVESVLTYIKRNEGDQMAVADIASAVSLPHSHARYMLDLLIKQGRIEKVPIKTVHKYYARYTYKFIK